MKFKKLHEEFTSDDLYKQLVDYIYNTRLEGALDNIAIEAASDIPDYNPDWSAEEITETTQQTFNALKRAAEFAAQDMLMHAPEVIHEAVNRKNNSLFKRLFHNALSDLMLEFKETGIDADKFDLQAEMEIFCSNYFNDIDESCSKKKLEEKQWKHELTSGKKLRQAIDSENYEEVKNALKDCYREINQLIPDDFEEYQLEDKLEELDILDTEPNADFDVDEDDVEDNWNYALSDFYDFCDAYNIWVSM